mmetsp:Transcript_24336/g.67362  ORF Transcript_24336/g.67362 Transcript_24336/m.67362 type:complete len:281 (+) Transcript_24336:170-1012(+)
MHCKSMGTYLRTCHTQSIHLLQLSPSRLPSIIDREIGFVWFCVPLLVFGVWCLIRLLGNGQVAQPYRFRAGVFLVPVHFLDGAAPQVGIVGPHSAVTQLHRGRPVKPGREHRIVPESGVHRHVHKGPPPDLCNPAGGDLCDGVGKTSCIGALVLVPVDVARVKQDPVDLVIPNNGANVDEIGRPAPLHNVAAHDNYLEGPPRIQELRPDPRGLLRPESVAHGGVPVPVVVRDDKVDVSPVERVVDTSALVPTINITTNTVPIGTTCTTTSTCIPSPQRMR